MDRGSKGLWDGVEEVLRERGTPQITVSREHIVIVPKVRKPKRLKPVCGAGWLMKTPAGHALRCRNRGCMTYVPKKSEAIACSPRCARELREFYSTMLDVLNGRLSARDIPPHMLSGAVLRDKK